MEWTAQLEHVDRTTPGIHPSEILAETIQQWLVAQTWKASYPLPSITPSFKVKASG